LVKGKSNCSGLPVATPGTGLKERPALLDVGVRASAPTRPPTQLVLPSAAEASLFLAEPREIPHSADFVRNDGEAKAPI